MDAVSTAGPSRSSSPPWPPISRVNGKAASRAKSARRLPPAGVWILRQGGPIWAGFLNPIIPVISLATDPVTNQASSEMAVRASWGCTGGKFVVFGTSYPSLGGAGHHCGHVSPVSSEASSTRPTTSTPPGSG